MSADLRAAIFSMVESHTENLGFTPDGLTDDLLTLLAGSPADDLNSLAARLDAILLEASTGANRHAEVIDAAADLVAAVQRTARAAQEARTAPQGSHPTTEAPNGRQGGSQALERGAPVRWSLEGSWLVARMDACTCDPHYGAHHPYCGVEPIVDLALLPGWEDGKGRHRA